MSKQTSVDNKADASAAQDAQDFGQQMQGFWAKNRALIIAAAVGILVVAVAREGWDYFNGVREHSIQDAYAQAGDNPDKLTSFAAEYSSHPLAGIAWLRLADLQYLNRDYKSATTSYQRAAGALTDNGLKTRARLGAAMSLLAGGDLAGGEAALKPLTTDESADKLFRAEACYHAATLAKDAGRLDEVRSLTDLISKIDPMSPWAQRAFALRASLISEPKAASTLTLPVTK
ncbi:MAG TPA: tetratricopeptide repeat protein [Candidatus Didemnitutus sp.]|nr:tetratricopeptide repeat protein [Candidatus Didemnitutus sp.]